VGSAKATGSSWSPSQTRAASSHGSQARTSTSPPAASRGSRPRRTSSSARGRRATTSGTGSRTKLRDGEEIGWPAPYWYVDAGAAFLLLQLAAIDEGLAAGVYGVLPEQVPEVKALLAVPEDVHFVCLVTIGHPAPDPQETRLVSRLSQRRLALDELVRWERWVGTG